jgi:hypothetical protein
LTAKRNPFKAFESVNDAHIRNAVLLEPDSGMSPPSAKNQVTFLPNGGQAFQIIMVKEGIIWIRQFNQAANSISERMARC